MDVKTLDNIDASITYVFLLSFISYFHILQLRIKLLRYDHGYKPFFIDMTIDACKFMNSRRDPIMNIFYRLISDYSNINHTCPYDVSMT